MSSIDKIKRLKGLYFILNISSGESGDIPLWLEGIMANGVRIIQVRGKDVHPLQLAAVTRDVVRIAKRFNITVVVNDFPAIALETGAHGVHLGAKDKSISDAKAELGKDGIVGATVRTVKQASRAVNAGADYVACGSMFKSPTKPSVRIVGVDILAQVKDAFPDFPVCAIGGITLENVNDVLATGVDMVAVISGIASARSPEKAAMAYSASFELQSFLAKAAEEKVEYSDDDLDD